MSRKQRDSRSTTLPQKRPDDVLWNWVLSEALNASQVTDEHIASVYGFASRTASSKPICKNKFAPKLPKTVAHPQSESAANQPPAADEDLDILIEEDPVAPVASCSKKSCLSNPNCLNYVGQAELVDEGSTVTLLIYL